MKMSPVASTDAIVLFVGVFLLSTDICWVARANCLRVGRETVGWYLGHG